MLADRTENDASYRVLDRAGDASRNGVWTVLVAAPTEEIDEADDSLGHSLIVAGGLVILLSAAGAWLLGSAALRAVDRLRGDVEAITAADIAARVKVPPGRDELAALGSTFNALLDRLGFRVGQTAPIRGRRRSRAARAAGRTPHGARAGRSSCRGAVRSLALAVRAAADEVERMARLADDLLFLARSDDGELQVRPVLVPLEPLLLQATGTRALSAADRGVTLEVVSPPDLQVEVDPDRLRHALDNLLDNALRVTTPGGTRARGGGAAARARRPSPWRTPGPGSPRSSCRGRSNASAGRTRPAATTPAVRGWGWRSSRRWPRRTAGRRRPGTPRRGRRGHPPAAYPGVSPQPVRA